MANYLICDNCQHKNSVTSERIVFCKSCQKKLANNYLDWKKTKFNSSFETYVEGLDTINEVTSEQAKVKVPIKEKAPIFKTSISSPSKKSLIFITSVLIQLLLAIFFTQYNNNTIKETEEIVFQQKVIPTTNYLNDINWTNYAITPTISISVPFELKKTSSRLPYYMESYINNHTSFQSESSQSFSVTVEKMNFDNFLNLNQNEDFVSMKDSYMKRAGETLLKEEGLHTTIKGYKTYVEHGSYSLNGKEYLYENYTLTKGNEGVKIVLSYLKHDNLLCKYADIVSQSLLNS